jgi:NADH-quinone oxidoreductase subunit L
VEINFQFIGLLLLPWISALLLGLFAQKAKKYISNISISLSFVFAVLLFYFIYRLSGQNLKIGYPWMTMGHKIYFASFWIDSSAKLIALLVSIIGFLVQVFSKSYMEKEANIGLYYVYLHGFVGAMICLIFADQIYIFYGSWELVGAFSYLLISFWHQKPEAIRAAKKAFLINRFADIALIFGLISLSSHFQTTYFSAMDPMALGNASIWVGIALFIGAMGKSAQFPFMSWLPDAMEGPTPASALIHAATMVAAGVFLGIRIFPFFGESLHLLIACIGAISLIAAGILALFQKDIKKILAYSTISQLGLMWMGMGSDASMFHLWVHGIFKAGLFLSAGFIIQYVQHQNLNHMGGLRKQIPITCIAFLIFSAGMMGIPLTSGFYSKENIAGFLWISAENSPYSVYYYLLLGALSLGMILTSFYASRLFYLIFLGNSRQQNPRGSTQNHGLQMIPIVILAILSLSLVVNLNPLHAQDSEFLRYFNLQSFHVPDVWLWITMSTWILGILLTLLTRHWIPKKDYQFLSFFWPSLFQLILLKSKMLRWIEVQLYDRLVNNLARVQVIIAHLIAWFDRWIVDGILVGGMSKASQMMGARLSRWQSGKVQSYWILVFVTFGLFLLFTILQKG